MSIPTVSLGTLIRLAVPSAIFTLLTNGYRIVDQYYSQTISVEAQAAIGASVFVLIFFYAVFELPADGAGPLIARMTGAGDEAGRRRILGAAVFGTLVLTAILMVLGITGLDLIVQALGLQDDTAAECRRYLQALIWTSLPLMFTPLLDQSFLSIGNARTPMQMHLLSLLLNIVLVPVFIHRLGLGITGAAYASNLAHAVAAVIGYVLLQRITGLRLTDIRPQGELLRIFRIGLPMSLGTAFFSLVYWAMLKTSISPLGPEINAALGIGFSALESFTWPIFHGLAIAAGSLVGRCLGAERPDLASASVRLAIPLASGLGIAASALFYLGSSPLTALFTDDPQVHAAAIQYAVILAASQFALAWESLAEGVLAGAGATRTVLWCSAPVNLIRIPLAWVLAFPVGLGASGIWWAINLTTYAKAFCKCWAIWRGRWKAMKI